MSKESKEQNQSLFVVVFDFKGIGRISLQQSEKHGKMPVMSKSRQPAPSTATNTASKQSASQTWLLNGLVQVAVLLSDFCSVALFWAAQLVCWPGSTGRWRAAQGQEIR